MKRLIFFTLFFQFYVSFAQSKKMQIEILNIRVDSLNTILSNERNSNTQKTQELNYLITNLENQISTLKKKNDISIQKLIEQISILKDSGNYYKKEFEIINIWYGGSPTRSEFGNLIILSVTEEKYRGGEPDEFWNGDSWSDVTCQYLYKEGGGFKSVALEACFNANKQALLLVINNIAKQQFKEDYEVVQQCGAKLMLPLSFEDLELHFDGVSFCFEYDVGLWKGNVCGLPRDQVCFGKEYIGKFLK